MIYIMRQTGSWNCITVENRLSLMICEQEVRVQMDKIDFVIPWVDGNDPAWIAQRKKYQPDTRDDDGESRYRDWENLQYWFRGVEKFAPWVNKVYFLTWGHVPVWLDTSNPKVQIVRHEDYIPKDYLPTFSSHPIEMNMHRIQGLSEHFVYFNDDMFLIRNAAPEDFFKNGLPRDCCIETALAQDNIDDPFAHILMNNTALINMHFNKKEVIRKNWKKWFSPAYGKMVLRNVLMYPYQDFSGFKYTHMPSPFLKSYFEKLWQAEGDRLDKLCHNRFRTAFDVNQYVVKHWQCMEGMYEPQSPGIGRFCVMGRDDEMLFDTMEHQSAKMICINDDARLEDFPGMKQKVIQAFDRILPEKSSFEK